MLFHSYLSPDPSDSIHEYRKECIEPTTMVKLERGKRTYLQTKRIGSSAADIVSVVRE
jgi:hypothetical protein